MNDHLEQTDTELQATLGPRFSELCASTPVELSVTRHNVLGPDTLHYMVETHLIRPISNKYMDEETGAVSQNLSGSLIADQLDNMDSEGPFITGMVYEAQKTEDGIRVAYYLSETTEHEFLAGNMVDLKLPPDKIFRSFNSKLGIHVPDVPGNQHFALTTTYHSISDSDKHLAWIAAWGRVPEAPAAKSLYINRVIAIATAINEAAQPVVATLKAGKKVNFFPHLVCFDTSVNKYVFEKDL